MLGPCRCVCLHLCADNQSLSCWCVRLAQVDNKRQTGWQLGGLSHCWLGTLGCQCVKTKNMWRPLHCTSLPKDVQCQVRMEAVHQHLSASP